MSELLTYSPLLQALWATLLSWLVTALGAALVLLLRRPHPLLMDALLAFGAGVMLASSYFSLLSPAIPLAESLGQSAWLVCAGGFLLGGGLLLLTDQLLARISCTQQRRSILLASSVTLHNIPEGLAIGVSFGALTAASSPAALTAAWMLAVGIALQNFPEGAAVSLPLRREGMSRRKAFFYGQLSGMVEPVAAVLGCLLAMTIRPILPIALSLAAGAMVVVVIDEIIPELQRSRRPALMSLSAMLGFAVMMTLDVALG